MIIASAIFKEKVIYIGKRHNNIINSHEKGFFNKNSIQGFLTDDGDFLNRVQALEYAYRYKQISKELYKERIKYSKELFSEDLW